MADDKPTPPPAPWPEVTAALDDEVKRKTPPHWKRLVRAQSLANLRPCRPGEVRNPKGKNGFRRTEFIAAWLETPTLTDPDKTRIEKVLETQYARALKGSDPAAKVLLEFYGGKPRQQMDVTSGNKSLSMEVLTSEELRKLLQAQLAEPDDGKDEAQEIGPDDEPVGGHTN